MIIDVKYPISPEIYEKCTLFAQACVGTNIDKYASRNQFNVEKIKKDIRNGKIGEEIVYEQLKTIFPFISKPDHNIYEKKDKSWAPDLVEEFTHTKFAVKSQDIDSNLSFGESWVFQCGNKDKDAEIFGNQVGLQLIAFVSLNVPKRSGQIRALVDVSWLHNNSLFKPMQKESLRNNKLAVYYDDLETFKDQLWQI